MANRTATVIYNASAFTQTIETYPPEWWEGVPSSASCSVYGGTTSNDDDAEFSPTITVDSTSLTILSASGYSQTNRRRLILSSTSGLVVGREYRLINGQSQREKVVVTRISADAFAEVEDDLAYDYAGDAGTSTVAGLRMTFDVDSTFMTTDSNILLPEDPSYRCLWTYTVNSLQRRHYTYLRLVRQIPKHSVTLEDIKDYLPDVLYEEAAQRRGDGLRHTIDAAYDRVRIDMLAAGYRPEQFRDTEIVDELVRAKVLALLAFAGTSMPNRDVELFRQDAKQDYEALFAKTVSAKLRSDLDQGSEGASEDVPEQAIFFRR